MTLLDSDIGHDATDCRTAYNQGRLTYNGGGRTAPTTSATGYATSGVNHIIWGDDARKYARDGECDEPNFGTGACTQGTDRTDCGNVAWMRNRNDRCDNSFNGKQRDHHRQHVFPQVLALLLLAGLEPHFRRANIFEPCDRR